MSIDELITEKTINDVVISLEQALFELKNVINPLKLALNPSEKKKKELFQRVKDLRIETEELVKKMKEGEDNKDLRLIRKITNRVKEIIEEKQLLKNELKRLDFQNEII
jgi:hypothetical protein